MICEQIQPKLYLMADGELSENEIVQVETHLAHCRRCKSFYNRLLLENQNLSAALIVPTLQESEIRHLEKRVLQHLAPPLHVVTIERVTSLMGRLFVIVAVLVSCSIMLLLQIDTRPMFEKIAQELVTAKHLPQLALNIAVGIFITFIATFHNRIGWLLNKITKGGFQSCL